MNLERQINKLNTLFRTELGEPVYAWKWSESLQIGMRATHSDGSLKYDYVANPDSGILVAKPFYEPRPLLQSVKCQWVLCRLIPSVPEDLWLQQFGSMLEWPRNGIWTPCTGRLGCVAIERGKAPTEDDTWEIIRCVRAERSITTADAEAAAEKSIDQREKDSYNTMFDLVKDAAPAFGGVPGVKGHWSHGGSEASLQEGIA